MVHDEHVRDQDIGNHDIDLSRNIPVSAPEGLNICIKYVPNMYPLFHDVHIVIFRKFSWRFKLIDVDVNIVLKRLVSCPGS